MSVETLLTAELQILYASFQGQSMLNRLFFLKDDAWTTAELADLVAAVETNWLGTVGAVTSSGVSLTGARARNIGTDPWGAPVENILDTAIPGALASEAEPFFASATVQFRPPSGSLPARGYIRMPGLVESQVIGNRITTAARNDIAAAWSNFLGDLEGAITSPTTHAIVSLYEGYTLETHPDGTVTKKPTERASGLVTGVESVSCSFVLGRAVSRAGAGA